MKLVYSIILLLLLMPFVSADVETLGCFQQSTSIQLKQISANGTFNNVTSVVQPNSNKILGQVSMTKIGSEYNYTLSSNSTRSMGEYIVNGLGDIDGVNTIWNYNLFVTADGKCPENIPSQLIILIIGFILTFFGLYVPRLKIITIFGAILCIIMGVLTLYPGYSYVNNTTLFGLTLGVISIGTGFYFLLHDFFSSGGQKEHPDAYDDDE